MRRRSERLLYAANGVDLRVADVELTGGERVERPFIRTPRAAGAVVFHGGRVLLLWRHRPITGTWGWEIPLGEIGPEEEPEQAAARHVEEQTGLRPGPLLPLMRIRPAGDVADCEHIVFAAHQPEPAPAPVTAPEARDDASQDDGDEGRERAEWVPMLRVQALIEEQAITSATTSAALLHFLADLLQARPAH
ncbi:NUDIX domain-containing protein [Nonomuraea fuscirosea]|jgi:8-oxo-dGTP pyrophosphatase MutT (NUDIX family)|uniref:ADP-ribose pyrophosphatase YjhB (NUDIX family) n=1 Tax=Nonomuraea fuscirosea TaxID=1291556 RepID=A0A2T0MTJ2_9ACTN|nr:NUDIX domain-containing protein [Nonomuraea fuscirosea]PRX61903.1 ADP-ribose pyrophosphatase YjhB (NUDIX family) [Nonomuraea fuscirosea]WSA48802.1 NUDIX domain-containing protein [Nonomuraea fuscirosea]